MDNTDRPVSIATILNTLQSGEESHLGTELETYIAELETRQPERPPRIAAILSTINAQYPAEIGASLIAYITNLEATQRSLSSEEPAPVLKPELQPVWSHQRAVERERQRRERAWKRQQDYR